MQNKRIAIRHHDIIVKLHNRPLISTYIMLSISIHQRKAKNYKVIFYQFKDISYTSGDLTTNKPIIITNR